MYLSLENKGKREVPEEASCLSVCKFACLCPILLYHYYRLKVDDYLYKHFSL